MGCTLEINRLGMLIVNFSQQCLRLRVHRVGFMIPNEGIATLKRAERAVYIIDLLEGLVTKLFLYAVLIPIDMRRVLFRDYIGAKTEWTPNTLGEDGVATPETMENCAGRGVQMNRRQSSVIGCLELVGELYCIDPFDCRIQIANFSRMRRHKSLVEI
jgi:hypothetical protein